MTYSCTDFTDDILNALRIEVPRAAWDFPEAQVDLATAEIERLRALAGLAAQAKTALEKLIEWDALVGNHDAKCWAEARRTLQKLAQALNPSAEKTVP
jgi:hypothetical protein